MSMRMTGTHSHPEMMKYKEPPKTRLEPWHEDFEFADLCIAYPYPLEAHQSQSQWYPNFSCTSTTLV